MGTLGVKSFVGSQPPRESRGNADRRTPTDRETGDLCLPQRAQPATKPLSGQNICICSSGCLGPREAPCSGWAPSSHPSSPSVCPAGSIFCTPEGPGERPKLCGAHALPARQSGKTNTGVRLLHSARHGAGRAVLGPTLPGADADGLHCPLPAPSSAPCGFWTTSLPGRVQLLLLLRVWPGGRRTVLLSLRPHPPAQQRSACRAETPVLRLETEARKVDTGEACTVTPSMPLTEHLSQLPPAREVEGVSSLLPHPQATLACPSPRAHPRVLSLCTSSGCVKVRSPQNHPVTHARLALPSSPPHGRGKNSLFSPIVCPFPTLPLEG